MYIPWTVKHKPKTLLEVIGNEEAKGKIVEWIRSWDKKAPKKKALFLYGSPGIGKTAAIESIAKDLDMELIESNASNNRTAEAVQRSAGRASEYGTLFGKKRLILLDELDGITGSEDRGGIHAITTVVKETRNPLVLIANNPYDPRFSTLRENCVLVEFKKPSKYEVVKHLRKICFLEGIEAEDEALKFIAERTGGDVRSAVNDLQALAQGKKQLKYQDVSWLADRDRKEVIFTVLRTILYAKDGRDAKMAVDMADVDPDMLFEWIYENVPHHVKDPKELAVAMDALSRADIYRRRVGATQDWTLMRYFIDLMTVGVSASWSKRSPGWVPFKFPERIRFLSSSKAERAMLSAIGMKIKRRCHISSTRAVKEILPYIRIMFENSSEMADGLAEWFELDEEMIDYLTKK